MNTYMTITGEAAIPCTEEMWVELQALLDSTRDEVMEAGEDYHQIEFEWNNCMLYAYSDSAGNPDDIPESVLEMIGTIIGAAPSHPYWEFGYARYGDKQKPASSSGGAFRIYPDGCVVWADLTFPRKELVTQEDIDTYIRTRGINCLRCGSPDIRIDNTDVGGSGVVTCHVECDACGSFWDDIHTLTGVENIDAAEV